MSKKKCKHNVMKISSYDQFKRDKPLYNGFAGGYGPHGDLKYNRRKEKDNLKRILEDN